MKKIVLSLAGVLAATAFAPEASAVPAFARQQGKACSTCHFQHYPALNDYGRSFKAGGYTDMGKQGLIKGPAMSLPEVANSSLFFKFRYQDSNGTDPAGAPTTASGEWQIPDEFALLMGGRVAENIGYMFEGQLASGTAPVLAGFKMPIMFPVGEGEMKIGVVPFSTDALGAAYGFELLNTGAVRNIRVSEMRSETSAQQYIGTARGAQGVAFVVADPMFFVNVSKYADGGAGGQKMLGGLTYLRAAVTPTVGEWDIGAGIQSWSGTITDATGVTGSDVKATAIDAQAQGAVAGMPLGVYFTYATAPATSGGSVNALNGNPNSEKATTVMAEFGVLPGTVTVMAAYRKGDTGAATNSKDDALTFGATYAIAQNVSFQVSHTTRSKNGATGRYDGGGDQLTNFMLSAGL